MADKKFLVNADQFQVIDRMMCEIKRQLQQEGGSWLDPNFVFWKLREITDPKGLLKEEYEWPSDR